MSKKIELLQEIIGKPSGKNYLESPKLQAVYDKEDLIVEEYSQVDGQGRIQRIMLAIPKNLNCIAPAVIVPFYFPEGMLGFNPKTNEKIDRFKHLDIMLHLVKRGYITVSSDAYYLTFKGDNSIPSSDNPWICASSRLIEENPSWSGIGKLIYDTKLLIDLLVNDNRVDSAKIGVAGHSLGGKMAFYAGCLDGRIKVILASDFGFKWEQSNWDDPWYYGDKLQKIKKLGINHADLLEFSQKPFCLLAGEYDNDLSLKEIRKAKGYESDEKLLFINHASGHYPPIQAIEKGYDFLDKYLK